MNELMINSLDELPKAADELLKLIGTKKIVAFYGKMGAGKTTLIKSICEKLKSKDLVNSPTFSLVNEYFLENGETVYHFDFYRIESLEEVFDIGYEDYFFGGGLCLVEWPEKVESLLPEDTCKVQIEEIEENKRRVSVLNV